MGIYARIRDGELGTHEFSATIGLWLNGDLTNGQALGDLNLVLTNGGFATLTANEQTQISDIQTLYNSLGASDQSDFLRTLEMVAVSIRAINNSVDKAKAASILGFTAEP